MKKTILYLFLFVPIVVQAQGIRFNLMADPQISWMVPDSKKITSDGTVFGINAGLGMDYFFTENYAFSTGISINNIGGKLQYADTLEIPSGAENFSIPPLSTVTFKLQYLNIPIGLKFKTNEIGYMTYFANLGVTPMINVRDRASDVSETLDSENIADAVQLFNMNYFINLGIQYSLGGSTALIGGLGYSSGFLDVTTGEKDKITVNTFTIKVGVLF
jgi:hypothetical protein